MVKHLLLLFFLFCGIGLQAQDTIPDYFPQNEGIDANAHDQKYDLGKEERHFRMVHKTNPFTLLVGNTVFNSELRYMNETVLYKQFTIMLSGSYLFKGVMLRMVENLDSNRLNGYPKLSLNGFRFQAGLRYYPISRIRAPRGLWLGPHFSYLNYTIKARNSSSIDAISVTHWNINLLLGYQFIAGRVCFDLYAGLGYKKNDWNYIDSSGKTRMNEVYEAYPYYSIPFKLNFGANFGLAF